MATVWTVMSAWLSIRRRTISLLINVASSQQDFTAVSAKILKFAIFAIPQLQRNQKSSFVKKTSKERAHFEEKIYFEKICLELP